MEQRSLFSFRAVCTEVVLRVRYLDKEIRNFFVIFLRIEIFVMRALFRRQSRRFGGAFPKLAVRMASNDIESVCIRKSVSVREY